jgi:polyisoprenyl-phosphate glycosyltransferase
MPIEHSQNSKPARVARIQHLAIVIPVFNDWPSLSRLIVDLDAVSGVSNIDFSVLVIDDGSTEALLTDFPVDQLHRVRSIEIIALACNMGHQRAIAVGLVEAFSRQEFDAVLVMDADGEDRPADIPRLVDEAARHPGNIVCARRGHRPRLYAFRVWYACYRLVFRVLTGSQLDFGNFCLIPRERLRALVNSPSIWNHLASTLSRARIPLWSVPTDRGMRYSGRSRMNFVSLVMHGLSAMAVYSDIVMVRLLLAAAALGALTIVGLGWVVFVKLFTALAIPGWATSAAGVLVIVLVQAMMLFTIAALNMMSTRSVSTVIPMVDAPRFILSRRAVSCRAQGVAAE